MLKIVESTYGIYGLATPRLHVWMDGVKAAYVRYRIEPPPQSIVYGSRLFCGKRFIYRIGNKNIRRQRINVAG